MKIKINGFKSLIKAVQNRAHLFPVKVLVNGKTKSYYSIRYKTGNKAMEIARKQMRIPNDADILFDSKDGKKKNLTENDVLKIYDKAGKPGSLQEFISANFKKPTTKPKNSTTVDLEQQQMSIDDLMQGDKEKTKEKEESLVEWAERKAKEGKGKEIYGNPRGDKYVPYKSKVTKEQLDEAKDFFKDKNTKIYPYDKGVRDDEELFSNKEVNDASNLRAQMIIEYNGYIESIKNHVDDKYRNPDTTVSDYKEFKNTREVLLEREQVNYWNEARNEGVNALHKLESFDERYMAKKRLEEKRNKKEQNAENSNTTSLLETEVLNTLGIKLNNKSDITKLKPKLSALKKLIGKKGNVINGKPLTERASKEIDQVLRKASFNLDKMKISVESGNNYLQNLLDEALNRKVEEIKAETQGSEPVEPEEPEKIEEPTKEIERIAFKNIGMDGGLINYIKMREGTTRVESKGEYKQVKNINELVNQVKPLKDSHTKIKGRAIMDMFGISADLYSKSNNIPFPTGSVGYCSRQYNEKTGKGYISEIGLVADRGNSYDETKTAVHECMHAKLTLSGKNKLMDSIYTSGKKGKQIILKIEEPMVELAGQAVARQIHGDEANKSLHSYATFIADFLPRVWTSDIFKNVRKKGSLGIGQAIAEQLTSGNVDFINKVYDSFNANDDKKANSNRMKAIETKMLERTDKVEKIQNDTGVSSIANLVEELKRGTISLEGALNSSKYRELAAVLIAKFLEDEDLEVLEGLALSF